MIGVRRVAVVLRWASALFVIVTLTACFEEFPTLFGMEVVVTSPSTFDVAPRSNWGQPLGCTLVREVWIGDAVDRYERTIDGGRYERIVFEDVPLRLDTAGAPIDDDGTIAPGVWGTVHELDLRCWYDDGSLQRESGAVVRPIPRFERIEPVADSTTSETRTDVVLELVAELPDVCVLERRAETSDGGEEVERRLATPTGGTLRFEAVPLIPPTVYDRLYEMPTVNTFLVRCDYQVEGGAWSQEDLFFVTTKTAEP